MVSGYAVAASAALAVCLSGCHHNADSSVYCKGTPITFGECVLVDGVHREDPVLCELNATLSEQAATGLQALTLLSNTGATLHSSTADDFIKLTLDPAMLGLLVATMDGDKLCVGLNEDAVSRLPQDKKPRYADGLGHAVKLDYWMQHGMLSRFQLGSCAMVAADEIHADEVAVSMGDHAMTKIASVNTSSLIINGSESAFVSITNVTVAKAKATLGRRAFFNVHAMNSTTFGLQIDEHGTFQAMEGNIGELDAFLASEASIVLYRDNWGPMFKVGDAYLNLGWKAQVDPVNVTHHLQATLGEHAAIVWSDVAPADHVDATCAPTSSLCIYNGSGLHAVDNCTCKEGDSQQLLV